MRYTSQAAMESQGLRDVERWKDKIEVRLDNRQVAFLFFGSALCACMLFILGVIVGKRLESRGRAMAPEIEDPLALLDRVAATTSAPPVAVASVNPARARRASPPAPATENSRVAPARAPEKVPPKPVVRVAEVVPPPAEARPLAARAPGSLPEAPSASEVLTEGAPAGARPATTPRFMLQVGSFSVRAEADALASSFAGQNPTVVPSDIPGKGLWYRVRVGSFQSFKEAIDAKIVFEKKHNKIALVIGPL